MSGKACLSPAVRVMPESVPISRDGASGRKLELGFGGRNSTATR